MGEDGLERSGTASALVMELVEGRRVPIESRSGLGLRIQLGRLGLDLY